MNKIITLGDNLLRTKSSPIENFKTLLPATIIEMFEIMKKARGVGLAAVQVGILQRFFITDVSNDKKRIFINPEIIETSLEEDEYEEGCLSIPGINYEIIRPYFIKIQAWNERGRPFTVNAEGMLARVIQHEYDHLDGKLFIDRITENQRTKILESYNTKKETAGLKTE